MLAGVLEQGFICATTRGATSAYGWPAFLHRQKWLLVHLDVFPQEQQPVDPGGATGVSAELTFVGRQ